MSPNEEQQQQTDAEQTQPDERGPKQFGPYTTMRLNLLRIAAGVARPDPNSYE